MIEDYLDLLKRREQDAEVRSHSFEEEVLTKNKRRKSIAARIARRARKLRKLRIRRKAEQLEIGEELAVASRARRFSFRRRRG